MRIFVDTNIIISSMLFPNGKAAAVFNHIIKNHDIIFSDYTIAECKKVIELKFPDKKSLVDEFFAQFKFEKFILPKKINAKKFPKIRDVNDLPVLAAAILSDADILLTGDKDFCDIDLEKPLIFSPSEYFELI